MMKKLTAVFILMMLVLSLAACGGNKKEETTAAAPDTAAQTEDEEDIDEADEDDEEDEEESDTIVVADYDPDKYVKLGKYTGLTADIKKVEVTDEDLELQIETDLEDNAEEVDKTDPAEDGDYAVISYTVKIDGKEVEDLALDEYEIVLGWGDAGEEVESAIIGKKTGDTVTAKMTLDESYGEDYDGKEAEFNVKIDRIYSYVSPELTDDYVKENTDYKTVDEYKEALKKQIYEELDATARQEACESLIAQISESSECDGYPQDLYDSVYQSTEELYAYYAAMFGSEREDLISDEELADAVSDEVNVQMILKAIAKKENLELTDEEYKEYLESNAADYGFQSAQELEDAYGESELRSEAAREKINKWLIENNNLNELSEAEYEAKYGSEYDDAEDAEDDMDAAEEADDDEDLEDAEEAGDDDDDADLEDADEADDDDEDAEEAGEADEDDDDDDEEADEEPEPEAAETVAD